MNNKIEIITFIITIVGLLIAIYDFIYKYFNHIQMSKIHFILPSRKKINEKIGHRIGANNTQLMFYSFITYLESITGSFYLKNRTTHQVEIYGCYLEVCFSRVYEKLLIPLKLIIERDGGNVDTFLSDWRGAIGVDSYFLPEQSCTSIVAKIERLATSGHIWFENNINNTIIPNILYYLKNHGITTWKLRCRVICKDSFDKKYYSKRFKIKMNLKIIYEIQNYLIKDRDHWNYDILKLPKK